MDDADVGPPDTVGVELDVYSGRPNPSWQLPPAEAAEFAARLAALPKDASRAPPAPDLGYRGLTTRVGAGPRGRVIAVARGTVTVSAGAAPTQYRDDGRALERWLLSTGRGHVDTELLTYVAAEIDRTSAPP